MAGWAKVSVRRLQLCEKPVIEPGLMTLVTPIAADAKHSGFTAEECLYDGLLDSAPLRRKARQLVVVSIAIAEPAIQRALPRIMRFDVSWGNLVQHGAG